MTCSYWLTCEEFTVTVEVSGSVITVTPPIVRRFRGQPIGALISWMRQMPGFEYRTDCPGLRTGVRKPVIRA